MPTLSVDALLAFVIILRMELTKYHGKYQVFLVSLYLIKVARSTVSTCYVQNTLVLDTFQR